MSSIEISPSAWICPRETWARRPWRRRFATCAHRRRRRPWRNEGRQAPRRPVGQVRPWAAERGPRWLRNHQKSWENDGFHCFILFYGIFAEIEPANMVISSRLKHTFINANYFQNMWENLNLIWIQPINTVVSWRIETSETKEPSSILEAQIEF